MSEVLEELVIKLTADISSLTASFNQASAESKKTAENSEKHLNSISKGFASVQNAVIGLAAAIGINLGFQAMKSLVAGSIEAIDAMVNLSDKTEISLKSLYGMKVLADDAGVSFESLTSSITKMERILSIASRGTNETTRALAELGLTAQELKKLKPEDAFFKISDALGQVSNHADKTRLSMALLGRGGAELTNVINAGSKGFEEAKKTAQELGLTLSRVDAQKVAQAKDQIELAQSAIKGVGQSLAVELAPYIGAIANKFVELAKQTNGLKEYIKDFVEAGVQGVGFLINVWHKLQIEWAALKVGVIALSSAFWDVIAVVKNLGNAVWETVKQAGSGFSVMAAAVKYAFLSAVEVVGSSLSSMLHSLSASMTAAGIKGADVVLETAYTVGRASNVLALDAKKNLETVSSEATKQAEKTKEAWTNIFDTTENQEIHDILNDAKKDLQSIVETPPPGTAIVDWLHGVAEEAQKAAQAVADIAPAEQEKTESEDNELTRYQQELQGKLAAMDIYHDDTKIKELEFFTAQQEVLLAAKAQALITEEEYQAALEDLQLKHQERINAIDQDGTRKNLAIWESGYRGKMKIVGDVLGQVAGLMNSKNREMFEVGKAAAYAQTVVNTASAAMGAYNAYASIPYVGPVLGAAAAAAAVVAGGIQLATISSTSFGGGGSAGGSFSTVSPSGGGTPPGLSSGGGPQGSASGVGQGAASTDITINVKGKDGMTKEELINLAEELNTLSGDGLILGKLKFV